MTDYGDGIYCVDSGYMGQRIAAVYVVREGARAAIIDTAHNGAFGTVMDALSQLGIDRANVDYVMLTHIHLDHAGGAGLLMSELPNARLIVHANGAKHMKNPDRLMAGVREVYGPEEASRMYGELLQVPMSRIFVPEDEREIRLGSRPFVCLDTPGHAAHHMAYFDVKSGSVFSGDVFGLSFNGLDTAERQGVIPSTSPVQFDPDAMNHSIDRIMALKPRGVFLSHFGEVRDIGTTAADLRRQIDFHVTAALESEGDFARIHSLLLEMFKKEARIQNWPFPDGEIRERLGHWIELNAQGLAVWRKKKS